MLIDSFFEGFESEDGDLVSGKTFFGVETDGFGDTFIVNLVTNARRVGLVANLDYE